MAKEEKAEGKEIMAYSLRENKNAAQRRYYANNRESINARARLNRGNESPETKRKAVERANEQTRKNKRAWKEIILERFGGGCVKCGYDKCWTALDLHHVEARNGNRELLMCKLTRVKPTPERVKALDDCILLCANCHREVHHVSTRTI